MEYLNYPLRDTFLDTLKKYPFEQLTDCDTVNLSFNIDGLQLFKSSGKAMWPVLCAVHLKPITVFPITLTCGNKRPTDLHFLDDMVADLNDLQSSGLQHREKTFKVNVLCIVCDAPAKALVRNTKLCSGYYGCDKCTQKGQWFNRVTYQETEELTLRTDEAFRHQTQEEHHHGNTPLLNLPIDMVKAFPIDYMHQACLGVMKKLLLIWSRGEKGCRMSVTQIQEVSSRLLHLKPEIPSIFSRKPRGLEELERWKATEFRQFMLYTGKVVLRGILRDDLYLHFLSFSVVMCILVSSTTLKQYSQYAQQLLQYFVVRGRELYGKTFLVYNTHTMLHITADAVLFDGLDNCSAFKFESFLHTMKRMVRNGRCPLSQVVKRIEERKEEPLQVQKQKITNSPKDRAFVLDSEEGCDVIDETEKNGCHLCRVYSNPQPLFLEPCNSSIIGVFQYKNTTTTMRWIPCETIKSIAMKTQMGDKTIFMKILHKL
ncbi:uncharacterized protein LOC124471334 [Hypomesus transpacificus]|uniref:uncharacterized protein LOC124471334 n=1 Tax=Hypomesus transpacificus TaxID=137520 RepID=UPI001F0721EB|nr:uncharacterized protein LOC124471334 [Hypomesus transpacificus]